MWVGLRTWTWVGMNGLVWQCVRGWVGVHMRPTVYLHLVRSSLSVVGGKLSKLAGVARAGAAEAERAERYNSTWVSRAPVNPALA